ncbi:MAG: hypothetical protein ACC657_11425 [Thiohalomonadales bacterium]
MKTDTHPETVDIIAFLENPESSEFTDLELHLATCSDCRKQINTLTELQSNIQSPEFLQQLMQQEKNISPELKATFSEQKIEQYVDQNLSEKEFLNIDNLVKENPQALKTALHYASHQSAMQRELTESSSNNKAITSTRHFSIYHLLKKYLTFSTPAWLMVPVTAFASVVVIFIMSSQFIKQDNTMIIASYQDNAIIQFRSGKIQPGIGFFRNTSKKIKPFSNMKIELLNNSNLVFTWPKVENATSYLMRLQTIKQDRIIILDEVTSLNNRTEFKNLKLENNQRYQWILTGKTTANEIFSTSGGFVSH